MKNVIYFLILINLINVKCLNDLEFLLTRKELPGWQKNNSDNSNSICFRPKTSNNNPFSSKI